MANLVMPIGDPRDGFFYPTITLLINSYILAHRIRISEILPWDRKAHDELFFSHLFKVFWSAHKKPKNVKILTFYLLD